MTIQLLYSPNIVNGKVGEARQIAPETGNYLRLILPEGSVLNLPVDNSVRIFEVSPSEEI